MGLFSLVSWVLEWAGKENARRFGSGRRAFFVLKSWGLESVEKFSHGELLAAWEGRGFIAPSPPLELPECSMGVRLEFAECLLSVS